jgi:hypothetical protein
MGADDDTAVRANIAGLLEGGLLTNWQQRAYTSDEIARVVARLRLIASADLQSKLQIAGVTAHPYTPPEDADLEQGCSTCMYFERNRQYCNLPEFALPMRPEWSCVLWRI